jgi:hypothetical protein
MKTVKHLKLQKHLKFFSCVALAGLFSAFTLSCKSRSFEENNPTSANDRGSDTEALQSTSSPFLGGLWGLFRANSQYLYVAGSFNPEHKCFYYSDNDAPRKTYKIAPAFQDTYKNGTLLTPNAVSEENVNQFTSDKIRREVEAFNAAAANAEAEKKRCMVDCNSSYASSGSCMSGEELRSRSYWYSFYTPATSRTLSQNCALYKNRAIAPQSTQRCQGNYIAPECNVGTIEERKNCTKNNYKPQCVPDAVYANLEVDCANEEREIYRLETANLRTGCYRYWDAKVEPISTTSEISDKWRGQSALLIEQMKPAQNQNIVPINAVDKKASVYNLRSTVIELAQSKFVQPTACTPASSLQIK